MRDTTQIDRVLYDAAEWLMALPEPTHFQLAAAGELLLEAARVMSGQDTLAAAIAAAPNVRAGLWRPRPGGPPDTLDQLAGQVQRGCDCQDPGCIDYDAQRADPYALTRDAGGQVWPSDDRPPADVSRETSAPAGPHLCAQCGAGYGVHFYPDLTQHLCGDCAGVLNAYGPADASNSAH